MGRSSAEQAQQNRARIVEIAGDLFREKGVEAVSVAEVMAAAGMTVGGFYRHFASKEALVDEATAHAFRDALALWDGVLNSADEAGKGRLVAHYLRPDPRRHCPVVAFAPHAAGSGPGSASRDVYGHGTGALLAMFAKDGKPTDAQLMLFAAMIGARVLGEAAGDVDWVRAVKNAVVGAAA